MATSRVEQILTHLVDKSEIASFDELIKKNSTNRVSSAAAAAAEGIHTYIRRNNYFLKSINKK